MNKITSNYMVLFVLVCLCVYTGGCGPASLRYTPPSYAGYMPESKLPLTTALHFQPYDGNFQPYDGTTPLLLAKHRCYFGPSDFVEVLFGVATVRTVTSASEDLFAKCFEIRDPAATEAMVAGESEDLFAKGIELPESTLSERLALCKKQNIDVLADLSVIEYVHSKEEVMMTLAWTIYDVESSKQLLQEQAQTCLPNTAVRALFFFNTKDSIVENQGLCRQVVLGCVEEMVRSVNIRLSTKRAP